MRLDRFLTLHLFRQWQRAEQGGELPILMYHSVSDQQEKGAQYYRTATSPKLFSEQMALLRDHGFKGVNLRQGLALLQEGSHSKAVVITFDDGFRDFCTNAFPILCCHGFSATMFLPTAFIGDESRCFKDRECMSWSEVREMHKAGIEFGSHTVNHPKLYELPEHKIREELEISKATIEQKLGKTISSFAYPYAFPSADCAFVKILSNCLKNAGYTSNVTTRIGRVRLNDDPFALKRLPINSGDDAELFLAKIRGAYDWMNRPQDLVKKMKVFANRPGRTEPALTEAA